MKSIFISVSSEPGSRICADIWPLPRGSNTPLLTAGYLFYVSKKNRHRLEEPGYADFYNRRIGISCEACIDRKEAAENFFLSLLSVTDDDKMESTPDDGFSKSVERFVGRNA
ncbi:MAG: hypothetical protein SOZ59_00245 [Candidatus Limivivens sp.]|nr:hypothetical protein [Candidatus Limivivens sp.]